MTAKQEIQAVIDRYIARRESLSQQAKEIRLDTRFTPEYQAEQLTENEQEQGNAGKAAVSGIQRVVDGVKASFTQGQRRHAKQAQSTEYRLLLSSTIEMLKLGAFHMDYDSIRDSLKPFLYDKLAIAASRGALMTSGYSGEEVTVILKPLQDSEALPELLDLFMAQVKAACSMSPVYGMELGTASLGMVLSRWNEDMTGKNG